MERAAFLIEESSERIGCMLNPESLIMRRVAGVQPRRSIGGQLSGVNLTDDPLLYTGGGRTELDLDLLFDISLAGSTITTDDVRDLTRPLWSLTENRAGSDGYGNPPVIRFIWGKSWNIPGVVIAVSERLEQFDMSGAPQRSWLRMRLLRVNEPPNRTPEPTGLQQLETETPTPSELNQNIENDSVLLYETKSGGEDGDSNLGERLDLLAFRQYGDPSFWQLIAQFNNIDDPNHVPPGTILQLPPAAFNGNTA